MKRERRIYDAAFKTRAVELSKKFKVTTNSKHNYLVAENILDRNFMVAKPSQV